MGIQCRPVGWFVVIGSGFKLHGCERCEWGLFFCGKGGGGSLGGWGGVVIQLAGVRTSCFGLV